MRIIDRPHGPNDPRQDTPRFDVFRRRIVAILVVSFAACGFAGPPTTQPITGHDRQPFLLHIPGIGGHRWPDRMLTRGLVEGGLDAEVYIYDWTGDDEGLNALTNTDRHAREARAVADLIIDIARAQPDRPLIVTSHSGGTGIAAWAIALLPEDIRIRDWVLIAPALSPRYDLSPALARVKHRAYVFHSALDTVNGWGTRNFGTIDRLHVEAAGKDGFIVPTAGDATAEYRKLVQFPYDRRWVPLGNAGDHVGAMMRPFARQVIAPLLIRGELPEVAAPAQPATMPSD